LSDGRHLAAKPEYGMAESKQMPKANEAKTLDFETFVRAAMATGKPPAQRKKAAERRPRKGAE
jgi:hypothetical protein